MITVSDSAKEYLHTLLVKDGSDTQPSIRVGVKGGGCSGLEYELTFDSQKRDGDEVFEDKGVTIMVDGKSLLYLYGTELDYSGGLNGRGLQFRNPNATRTCSCGDSFAV